MSLFGKIKEFFTNIAADAANSVESSKEDSTVTETAEAVSAVVDKITDTISETVDEVSEVVSESVTEAVAFVEENILIPVETAIEKILKGQPVNASGKLSVPEDSSLKRHFITTLKYAIEADLGARPTDSTLKRHYDAMVNAELDNLLA